MGGDPNQVVKALIEAEAYDGPSLIICYSHCIAHGINMTTALDEQKKAVESGYWPLFRFDPRLTDEGKNPLTLDSKDPKLPFVDYAYGENRYRVLEKSHPDIAKELMKKAQEEVNRRYKIYKQLANLDCSSEIKPAETKQAVKQQ